MRLGLLELKQPFEERMDILTLLEVEHHITGMSTNN